MASSTVRKWDAMDQIGLAELVSTLRAEIIEAVTNSTESGIHFPIGQITLEFHVGVTRERDGKGGIRAWVIELGGGGKYAKEEIHTVTVTLDAPVDDNGEQVKVHRTFAAKP